MAALHEGREGSFRLALARGGSMCQRRANIKAVGQNFNGLTRLCTRLSDH
jgi:hypothetical protein